MNESFEQRRVGDIVAGDWRAAAIFEQFGIDFCCGGQRSVGDACRSAGIDAAAVARAFEEHSSAEADDDVLQWPVDRLTDHIVLAHHGYVRSAVPRLAAYLAKLAEVHRAHPELRAVAAEFDMLSRDLLQHMLKEEHILFPYIRDLAGEGRPAGATPFGTVQHPIQMMEREHEEAGDRLRAIRKLTNDYTAPADGCATYRVCFEEMAHFERDLHRHVHLENNVLFPKAVALEDAHH